MLSFLLVFCLCDRILADVAGYGSPHKGLNPTLYSTEDYVIQLDESSFNDTVYCNGPDCPAYLIEFYADWCGHCRGFAPIYKQLATDVKGWQNIVRIAAMNCADSLNEATCRANGVNYFPLIRYFPRNSSDAFSGSKLRPYNTVAEMRDQLTKVVMDDYAINKFHDWPQFDYLGDVLTYGDLWSDVAQGVDHMAVIFENHQASLTGAQLLMDLYDRRDSLAVRRCLKNHALATALHISDFPSLAIFKRGEKNPVLISELRRLMFTEIDNFLGSDGSNTELQRAQFSSRKNKTDICEKEPEKCKEMFYVSEVDMLKAMRYALYRETARTGAPLHGANLTALHSFTGLLADHFPVTSHNGENETYLDRSNRAVRVFARLRDFLEEKGLDATVPIDEWQKEFQSAEESAGFPFPLSADWDHCKGSTGSYRGYTCGLWTAFHTLSVAAYRQAEATQAENFQPLTPLHAIRDWVGSFFGCMHCRDHFLRMTTNTFKMESQVSKPEDVFMYLWRAHNIVNARLKGRDSEDPKFPKYQFPAKFLCQNCTTETSPDENEVKEFLIDYYSSIKPYVEENFTTKFFF